MAWVRVKEHCEHAGVPGGSVIRVTDDELRDFGDKFILDVAAPGSEATEAAQKLVEGRGVNLGAVIGSGEAGRVLKGDVEDAIQAMED